MRAIVKIAAFRQSMTRALAAVALLCAAGVVPMDGRAAAVPVIPADLRSVAWRDSDGSSFHLRDASAPLVVVTMSDSACKRVCSSTARVLADLQRRLDEAQRTAESSVVSSDPQNDSAQQWAQYRAKRGLLRTNWHFRSGDEDATRKPARLLDRDFCSCHDHIVHDFRVVVFDPQWHSVAEVDWMRMDELPERLGLGVAPRKTAATPER